MMPDVNVEVENRNLIKVSAGHLATNPLVQEQCFHTAEQVHVGGNAASTFPEYRERLHEHNLQTTALRC